MKCVGTFWNRWGQYLLPVILWMGLIFFLSAQAKGQLPSAPDGTTDWVAKKFAHMLIYGILAVLCWRALSQVGGDGENWRGWAVLAICLVYAVSDELHQAFVPGRGSGVRDVGIDMLGVCLALALTSWLLAQRTRHRLWFHRLLLLDRFLGSFQPLRLGPQDDPAK
jgi:VanZ family protein